MQNMEGSTWQKIRFLQQMNDMKKGEWKEIYVD